MDSDSLPRQPFLPDADCSTTSSIPHSCKPLLKGIRGALIAPKKMWCVSIFSVDSKMSEEV
jgi:hypothetical protein